MEWFFRKNDGMAIVKVVDDGTGKIVLTDLGPQTYTGMLIYDRDHDDRRSLHSIVAEPAGEGAGSILMWCFAVTGQEEADGGISLNGPHPDAYDWYFRLGFRSDPDIYRTISSDLAEGKFTSAEAEVAIKHIPMVGDAMGIADEAARTWQRLWRLTDTG